MADQTSLLNCLKSQYTSIPITTILSVVKKYGNNEARCREVLDEELRRYPQVIEGSSSTDTTLVNMMKGEVNSMTGNMRELQVSHEGNTRQPQLPERHISTYERPIVGTPKSGDTKRPMMNQSLSWTVKTPDNQSSQPRPPPSSSGNPQTAPADFAQFLFSNNRSPTDIPQINCNSHTPFNNTNTNRSQSVTYISGNSSNSSSPREQRRPVKVINIPPGSSSGGSVSPAVTLPNARHIRMQFGDTGGVCTVSRPGQPSYMRQYGSTPNITQHYRSEFRTEPSVPQPVHSSSIVVNTTSHVNNFSQERNLGNSTMNTSCGRRTPNFSINTSPGDSNPVDFFSSDKPLSTPVQASSPGIAHSKPVFVEVKRDLVGSYSDNNIAFYPGSAVRPPPPPSTVSSYLPNHYNSQNTVNYTQQFTNYQGTSEFPVSQQPSQPEPYSNNPMLMHPGYRNPTDVHPYLPSSGACGYDTSVYPPMNSGNVNFPPMPNTAIVGHVTGQNHMYTNFPPHHPVGPPPTFINKDSDRGISYGVSDFNDGLFNHYKPQNNMGSRVSSQSSVSSDSSTHIERERNRSGSMQEEADYIRALLQHQKERMQKLRGDTGRHSEVLLKLRAEVSQLEKTILDKGLVNNSFPSVTDVGKLCDKNRQLQTEIQMKMNELDMYRNGQTPFTKNDPLGHQNFFANMPKGQKISRQSEDQRPPSPQPIPPPRPPPPIPVRQRSSDLPVATGVTGAVSNCDVFNRVVPAPPPHQPIVNSGDSEEGDNWACSTCTFSNHPAISKCEMCEMPRVPPPTQQRFTPLPPRVASNNVAGGTLHPQPGSPATAMGHQHHHRAGT